MAPLEESAGIRSLIERYDYSQADVGRILNKSPSYISQILGLERLTQSAREILQTSEVAKEIQIQASKEKDPEKQAGILKKATEGGKTVRQIRDAQKAATQDTEKQHSDVNAEERGDEITGRSFCKWTWTPEDRRFTVTIQFRKEQRKDRKIQLIKSALEETSEHMMQFAENTSNPDDRQLSLLSDLAQNTHYPPVCDVPMRRNTDEAVV
jgi:ParB-like chromosome segregation protein Spo0J